MSDRKQAEIPDIEVTPEMVEAGTEIILIHAEVTGLCSAADLAERVYLAMDKRRKRAPARLGEKT